MVVTSLFYCREKLFPYKYMKHWKKLNETSLPEKDIFAVTLMWEI